MLLFMPTQDEYALRSHTLAHTAASVRTLVALKYFDTSATSEILI